MRPGTTLPLATSCPMMNSASQRSPVLNDHRAPLTMIHMNDAHQRPPVLDNHRELLVLRFILYSAPGMA